MYQCGNCKQTVDTATPEWTDTDGWRDVCQRCRLLPTLTAAGRLQFIRVGG